MTIRLQDIAKEVGVSVQVVSKVLNGGRSTVGASPETRRRITDKARELGYQPNAAGRALRHQAFRSVGLVMGGMSEDIFLPQQLVAGIVNALSEQHYTCSLVNVGQFDHRQMAEQPMFTQHMVDAMIMAYSRQPPSLLVEAAGMMSNPVVWLHRMVPENAVAFDEAGAAEALVDHLADRGHQAITYIDYNACVDTAPSVGNRLSGFYAGCSRRGVRPSTMIDRRVDRASRESFTQHWMYLDDRPSAVIVDSCSAAQVILDVALASGISFPDQMAIASYDNFSYASANAPGITCMISPEKVIGQKVAEMALELIRDRKLTVPSQIIAYNLWQGGTT